MNNIMGSHTPTDHSQAHPQQQYCLRWNNYQNNLTNVFDQLLQAEAFVDVTLSAEGHSLKAHKVVLCACSPYFQALFFDNPCKHPIVILNGVKWMQLKALTEFMYRGEINVAHDQLAPLLKVAELLKIRGLADVSHSRSTALTSTSLSNSHTSGGATPLTLADTLDKRPNPADFLSNSNHSHSGSESLSVNGHGHSHGRRKRRKMSTPERTPSPGDAGGDNDNSLSGQEDGDRDLEDNDRDTRDHISMSVNPIPSTPTAAELQRVLGSPGAMGPALLNLHAAAAAAAAVAVTGGNNSGSSSGSGPSSSTVGVGDMDIKPGIVEMIREEERAKMLESAHGWLGPGSSTLSESYQYQIQNLWQKCWNQNQGGMMHALRFRERGPLKSWRPETMAEAIFAVLREGLSLSQAARKYDIPYPTFVLYANRVHNMLGPSADGSTSSDLMSDMRPKGRGRPQRILLGTWPEEHIRGVIRAVVFRDTQTKDDIPFVFNRDGTLCLPQPSSSSTTATPTITTSRTPTPSTSNTATPNSQNGVDMSLHPHFAFSSPSTTATATDSHSAPLQQGSSSSRHNSSASSSNSSSPLQAALSSATAAAANFNLNLQAAAQSQLLAFQQAQTHFQKVQQQMQHSQGRRGSSGATNSDISLNILSKQKSGSSSSTIPNFQLANLAGFLNPGMKGFEGMKDIFQIKTELGSYDDNNEEEGDVIADDNAEDLDLGQEKGTSANGTITTLSFQQNVATDLRRSSPDKVNNNEKEGIVRENNDDEDGGDVGPVAVVQVQMDQGANKSLSTPSSSVIVGNSSAGVEQTSSPPR